MLLVAAICHRTRMLIFRSNDDQIDVKSFRTPFAALQTTALGDTILRTVYIHFMLFDSAAGKQLDDDDEKTSFQWRESCSITKHIR